MDDINNLQSIFKLPHMIFIYVFPSNATLQNLPLHFPLTTAAV